MALVQPVPSLVIKSGPGCFSHCLYWAYLVIGGTHIHLNTLLERVCFGFFEGQLQEARFLPVVDCDVAE